MDYSARVQVVDESSNPKLHNLLQQFGELTGHSVLVNTSFNVRGEPIVNSPADALKCFIGTNMDMLVLENFILSKEEQNLKKISSYHRAYDLD